MLLHVSDNDPMGKPKFYSNLCVLVYILIINLLIFLEINDISNFLKTSGDNLPHPLPQLFPKKEIDNLFIIYLCILSKICSIFFEFVVHLTKIY